MRKKIYLYWHKHKEGFGNFGDEINPYLIRRLTSQEVQRANFYKGTKIESLKTIAYNIFYNKLKINELKMTPSWHFFFKKPIVLAIGSIIQHAQENHIVWGSGIISKNDKFENAKFLAVRGFHTLNKIKELGYHALPVLGDPALLLPKVYQPKKLPQVKVGIIPHHIHYEILNKNNSNPNIKVINLLDPVEKVIDNICSCDMTLSTSLHGVIVSHAYQIPSLWFDFEHPNKPGLAGDNVKFLDYFSSVRLEEYSPIKISLEDDIDFDLFFLENQNISLPSKEVIEEIQDKLLSVAPFTLKHLKT
ncbi:polysaccharide pyruvyl transferase family protein [Weeksellaceae bacterium KMM 9713]|uniref:Polysaccharide pyruvyl transferase family protein n=1 Tax=Profundicola chukchiensis TaxID=2961959 RepID=A0A9X4RUI1_9FLAO|nr:polysaccharide pyruvyl transferase family protein [Profundicola chukchiensis]MDG4944790.1 polysaccharide pyruvyl transferase family protein [Profundicola chukchiensis]